MNNLSDGLSTNVQFFADDASLFSVVDNLSKTNLNSDLSRINNWVNQWKMTFNPDPKVHGVIFFHKIKKTSHPPLNFNNNSVKQVQFQEHLRLYLDGKLDFCEHL